MCVFTRSSFRGGHKTHRPALRGPVQSHTNGSSREQQAQLALVTTRSVCLLSATLIQSVPLFDRNALYALHEKSYASATLDSARGGHLGSTTCR